MAMESNEYRSKLNETTKLYEHVSKLEQEFSELLDHLSGEIPPNDLENKLKTLEDQKQHYSFMHKTQLDDFIEICENLIHSNLAEDSHSQIHEDLVQAGFDFKKDGLNHPLLKQLY